MSQMHADHGTPVRTTDEAARHLRRPQARESSATLTQGVELRLLRYYLAVVEERHFGRAAGRLFMAQPPLSRAIRKLEDELNVQLLLRTTRAVVPTEAGVVFADEARKVLAGFEF